MGVGGQVHRASQLHKGDVIIKVACNINVLMIMTSPGQTCVELRMVVDAADVHLHIGEGLGVAVHVPLAQPHPQLFRPEDNVIKELEEF